MKENDERGSRLVSIIWQNIINRKHQILVIYLISNLLTNHVRRTLNSHYWLVFNDVTSRGDKTFDKTNRRVGGRESRQGYDLAGEEVGNRSPHHGAK